MNFDPSMANTDMACQRYFASVGQYRRARLTTLLKTLSNTFQWSFFRALVTADRVACRALCHVPLRRAILTNNPLLMSVPNGMKLTGIGISVAAVEVAGFLEEGVVLGAAFAAAGFEAIRPIGNVIVANELQQDA